MVLGVAAIPLFVGVGLWLIGIPLPITFGLVAGPLNVVPYLGSTVGALLSTLLAPTTDRPLLSALLVLALFVVVPNRLEGYVLQPITVGRQVKLHPVTNIVPPDGRAGGRRGNATRGARRGGTTTLLNQLTEEDPTKEADGG